MLRIFFGGGKVKGPKGAFERFKGFRADQSLCACKGEVTLVKLIIDILCIEFRDPTEHLEDACVDFLGMKRGQGIDQIVFIDESDCGKHGWMKLIDPREKTLEYLSRSNCVPGSPRVFRDRRKI